MRIIIHGVGAIGGVVGAALAESGQEVIGIARGRMLEAIRADGIRLVSPKGRAQVDLPCVAHPSEITFRPDDVVLLCVKGQDTEPALRDLRAAGMTDQPLVCLQNGVANERAALRYFPNVHGAMVAMPATYLEPGEVITHGAPCYGLLVLGRYPGGTDAADTALKETLDRANIATILSDRVMDSKYGKLLMNLGNIVDALLPLDADRARFTERLKDEARAVFAAAGIGYEDVGLDDPQRKQFMQITEIEGVPRSGSSTRQSIARGAGSVETDYLNGEIALLGRLHDTPAPLNARLTGLSARLVADGNGAGGMSEAELEAVFANG
ncbi:MAG: oxidoreductase [Rhodobacteraceae bacterium]|jgi:2-dehydropantoate 2-reductase|uniref:2-dehydropantoate 2-reductase n=1 Tax=Salipiger profundus TaxID=1229727 RepID=A0A1U7D3N6_9RHOB|nr:MULTISPECIES: 2-dehydropantoate 2-reductase [Salipiger]APX22759.1 2-dehydropantoate 2-reductase [Salipiger profundus]MAB05835.1 oxidoreductase [Paracoccaceae bacterium]GGA09872.1 2-dehydropantoate 2-reductase [Salipiger profundus]SFC61696.1 ketopantoate reductase [Salipiger profundus]